MEHVVFYPGPDAVPMFRRFGTLDEAVRFVEHLRNVEGVEDVSVHLLTPVPLAFRAYYKVEMPAADIAVPVQPVGAEVVVEPVMPEQVVPVAMDMPPADMPPAEMVPVDAVPVESGPAEPLVPVEAPVAANGKRSLGFFAH